jgi:hypothetical protein
MYNPSEIQKVNQIHVYVNKVNDLFDKIELIEIGCIDEAQSILESILIVDQYPSDEIYNSVDYVILDEIDTIGRGDYFVEVNRYYGYNNALKNIICELVLWESLNPETVHNHRQKRVEELKREIQSIKSQYLSNVIELRDFNRSEIYSALKNWDKCDEDLIFDITFSARLVYSDRLLAGKLLFYTIFKDFIANNIESKHTHPQSNLKPEKNPEQFPTEVSQKLPSILGGKTYISKEDVSILHSLMKGESLISSRITFHGSKNQLSQLFRDLLDLDVININKSNLTKWICDYFKFPNSNGTFDNPSYSSIYKTLTNKDEKYHPSKPIDLGPYFG